jgi:DNA-binding transcriptional LysR family regulator
MDRFEGMSLLVAVMEAGSFSEAGRRLNVPLPTISRKIADLETHLSTRLIVRTTRKLTLTDAGAAYLTASKRILEQVHDAERAASGEYVTPKGELTLSSTIVFGRLQVLPIVGDFLAAFPEVDVRLVLADRTLDLIDEHIDLAVRLGPLPDSNMVATRVGAVRRVVCASPKFLAAHGVPKTPADLMTLPCVSFSAQAFVGWAWTFALPEGGNQTVPVRTRLAVNTAEAAADAAIAGVGLTNILSYQILRAVAEGTLQIVLSEFEAPPIPVNLIHAGQGALPLKTRRFIEFAAPRLRKALSAL